MRCACAGVVAVVAGDAGEQVLVALARQQIAVVQRGAAEIGQQRVAAAIHADLMAALHLDCIEHGDVSCRDRVHVADPASPTGAVNHQTQHDGACVSPPTQHGEFSGRFAPLPLQIFEPSARLRDGQDPKVAALDLTFSAPKSVSVLFAIAGEEVAGELVAAHKAAVRAAVEWIEDTAVQVRRGPQGHIRLPGEGLIAAAYRHRMSRALDPQLHTHVVAANLTRGPDGRFTALFGAPIYQAAKTGGYLYQAHLRAEISERLGLEWGPVQQGRRRAQGPAAGGA